MKTLKIIFLALGLGISSVLSAFAATINVPADQPTIQAGINAAIPGDTVLVAPGTYIENISFLGKAITVQSSGGPGVTVIDGNSTTNVVIFSSGEGLGSVIEGFTITKGVNGGIYCSNTSPTIINNIITANTTGSGIFTTGGPTSTPLIKNNTAHTRQGSVELLQGGRISRTFLGPTW